MKTLQEFVQRTDPYVLAVYVLCGLLIYFAPSIIAMGKRDNGRVFFVNAVFGWTGIGWLVALLMAYACANRSR